MSDLIFGSIASTDEVRFGFLFNPQLFIVEVSPPQS